MAKYFNFVLLSVVAIVLVGLLQPGMAQDNCGGRRCASDEYCDDNICVKKKNLDEVCTAEGQCAPRYSECLGDDVVKTCQCQSAWTSGPENTCIVKCTESGTCSKGSFCSSVWTGGCLLQPNFKAPCNINESSPIQCKPEGAICETGTEICVCGPNYLEKDGSCIPKCTSSSMCMQDIEFCDTTSGECIMKKLLGQNCSASEECLTLNSECSESCTCQSGYSNYLNTACVPSCDNIPCKDQEYCNLSGNYCVRKANLNETCDNNGSVDQCLDDNAECDQEKNTCQCSDNYGDFNNQCILSCDDNDNCESNEFCNDGKVCEMKRLLGEECSRVGEKDECIDADDGTNVICNNAGRCACSDDSYQNGAICVMKCSSIEDCDKDLEFCNTADQPGRCTLKIELNGICNPQHNDPNQCKSDDAECNPETNLCSCLSTHIENSGMCRLKCQANPEECSEPNQFCSSTGACKIKSNLNQVCDPEEENEDQCMDSNSACHEEDLRCRCKDTHGESNAMCVTRCTNSTTCENEMHYCESNGEPNICRDKVRLDQGCGYEDQCATEFAFCDLEDSKRCKCSPNYYNYNNGLCLKMCTMEGESCLSTEFCGDDGCCKKKKPLGAQCTKPEECKTEHSTCNGVCECPATHFEENSLCIEKCTKTSVCDHNVQYCASNFKCYEKASFNQTCYPADDIKDQCIGKLVLCSTTSERFKCICADNSEKLETSNDCDCNEDYVENKDVLRCLKKATELMEPCEEDVQCKEIGSGDTNSTCSSGQCACTAEFIPATDKLRCLKKATALLQDCEDDAQCEAIGDGNSGSTCSDNICKCPVEHIPNVGLLKCLKKATELMEPCEEDVQCKEIGSGDTNSTCSSGQCACTSEFIPANDKRRCLKKATALLQSCENDAQCEAIGDGNSGSTCSGNICDCPAEHIPNIGLLKCLKKASKVGDECEEVNQCSVLGDNNAIQCSNDNKCSCTSTYVENAAQTKCLKKATELTESCKDNNQCKAIGDGNTGAECSTGKCSCPVKYIVDGSKLKCLKMAESLKDACEDVAQCSSLGEETECTEGKCQCKTGFMDNEDKKQCIKSDSGSGSQQSAYTSLLIFAALLHKYLTN